ncbi:glycosyltransferase family A protein [Brevibacillus sp. NRS-1366]|uniref:glycosyltransferase family A protein n=1 Tax=Brevibacillus sp. NRS-1366 TaxID=3233899 RepID=UPI003D236228
MLTSVVIPVRDAADQLLYTLFSFNLQFIAFEKFEVIVLDNASRDDVPDKIARFAANYPLRCLRFRRVLPLAQLLNTGIKQANGELIILLSPTMIVPREFIGVHLHAHEKNRRLVLLGLGARRIYSVYDPDFSPVQHAECREWLENYPYIKRPHTQTQMISLLEESQIVSGQPAQISLPCLEAEKRLAIRQKYGVGLTGYRSPWALFSTQHVSLSRASLMEAGAFRELPRIQMERNMAKRLIKAGCSFQFDDKLTLLKQECVIRKIRDRNRFSKKNRRA